MKVSVIIPTLNEEKTLEKCLQSIKNQKKKPFEIIVVDGESKDKTREIAKKNGAKVIIEKKKSIAAAKNTGAKISKGDILAFTDADSEVDSAWIERIEKNFQNKEVVCVGGPVLPKEGNLKDKTLFYLSTNLVPKILSKFGFYAFQGSNQSFLKSAFLKVGGFSEKLEYLEDNELPNRIKKEGKVIFDPKLKVHTSTRRFKKEGYLKATVRYLKAYLKIYFLKEKEVKNYPRYRELKNKIEKIKLE
ncbi:MAG: glycosyltransferase [archaeon]